MQVKIDTKEKFHVITPTEPILSATMTDGIKSVLLPYLKTDVKNIVFDMSAVQEIDDVFTSQLLQIQQEFYENNASFVTCCISKNVEEKLAEHDYLELLNHAPTQSEAWDILQMEEIERELLDSDEME